jgi:hypothetical protein
MTRTDLSLTTGGRSPSDASIAPPRAAVSWRVFLVLLLMAAAGSGASVPMNVHVLKHLRAKSRAPVGVVVQGPSGASQVVEPARSSAPDEDVLDDVIIWIPYGLLITAVVIAVGLAAARPIGLGVPNVRATPAERFLDPLALACLDWLRLGGGNPQRLVGFCVQIAAAEVHKLQHLKAGDRTTLQVAERSEATVHFRHCRILAEGVCLLFTARPD